MTPGDPVIFLTLISFLVGVILAFVGAVQLPRFGGQIYVADPVGSAFLRESESHSSNLRKKLAALLYGETPLRTN